jgi:uncharacterized membrane protein YdbT with pleckstrin-like domain
MPFPRKLLNDEEDVVIDLHPHWWFLAGPTAALVVTVVGGIVAVSAFDPAQAVKIVLAVLIVASVVWFAHRYARWATTNFVVTTDRLIYRHGVLAKHGIEIPLERVNTVFFNQSIFERMLRAGDLTIESAGETGRQQFTDIRKPSAVQNEIYRQMEANENRKFDRIGSPRSELSVPEQLEKLDELRRRGVLSNEEFESQKARLLGSS